ncbi:hypothetical protein [Maribellus mangrovi]|uniref:hypothetical protein n=1 Tax=Maribellus mangrovi TaxID=3133146 RepID=UPI0030ED30B7
MEEIRTPNIIAFLKSDARNKLVIFREELSSILPVDVGTELSLALKDILDDKRLSMKAKLLIEKLFNKSVINHPEFGNILALKNINILFEPELKIDFANLLDQYSKTNPLFLFWEGDIRNKNLYFLTEQGLKTNIKNISHIVV